MTRLPLALVAALAVTVATQTFSSNEVGKEKEHEADTIDPVKAKELEIQREFVHNRKAAMYNFQIAATALCPLSYLLNGLSVVVFLEMAKKQKQAVIYVMIGLCFSDAFSSATSADYILWAYFGKSPMQNTDWGCKFFNWVGASAQNCSNIFCLLIALERFFSVFFPLKVALWFTRRRIMIAMAALTVVFLSLESYRFWSFYHLLFYGVHICLRVFEMSTLSRELSLGFHRILGFLMPWTVVSILNLCIIVRLNRLRIERQKLGLVTNADKSHKNNQSLTFMFLSMSAFSLFSNVLDLYNVIYQLTTGVPYIRDYNNLIISNSLVLVGQTLNLVFYTMAGSNLRRILIGIVCSCRNPKEGPLTRTSQLSRLKPLTSPSEKNPDEPSTKSQDTKVPEVSTDVRLDVTAPHLSRSYGEPKYGNVE